MTIKEMPTKDRKKFVRLTKEIMGNLLDQLYDIEQQAPVKEAKDHLLDAQCSIIRAKAIMIRGA